jgi:Aspartyl protease
LHRVAASLVALMSAATFLVAARVASHVHVEPLVNFALPPATAGCGGATALSGGAERIPITVSTVAGQVDELVNVCINGRGPYPFVIDSGAGESIIDAHLAATLHLAHVGRSTEYSGVGCTGKGQPVALKTWSVAGVALSPQTLTAATLPDFGTPGQPVGLLGSDVLSRFGAVRIDFVAQTLTFAGPQGPVLSNSDEEVRGPTGPPPAAVLTQGEVSTTVPISVTLTPGDISLNVRLRFGKGTYRDFIVDTGSSQSVVASSVAKSAGLAHSDLAQRQTTVCSTITVPLVHSGSWFIPGVALHPQLVGSLNFGPIGGDGTAGLLGSDQLQRFGWVIFDYRGGRLVLG